MKHSIRSWPSLLILAAAAGLLSILLNIDYPAVRLFSWHLALPSVDVWLLLLPLALAACWGKRVLFWTTLLIWGSAHETGRVEMWRGGFGLRFHIPLIEPDMRI